MIPEKKKRLNWISKRREDGWILFLLALPVPCQRGAVFPGRAEAKRAMMLLLFPIVVIKPEPLATIERKKILLSSC